MPHWLSAAAVLAAPHSSCAEARLSAVALLAAPHGLCVDARRYTSIETATDVDYAEEEPEEGSLFQTGATASTAPRRVGGAATAANLDTPWAESPARLWAGSILACGMLVVLITALVCDSQRRPTRKAGLAEAAVLYGSLDSTPEAVCGFLPDSPPVPEPLPVPVPPPAPRLPRCGTSFVVPFGQIAACDEVELDLAITTTPSVFPYRAALSRPRAGGAWARVDLTVRVLAAAHMPPLFSCRPVGEELEITNSAGTLEGRIQAQKDGCCQLQRPGLEPWSIEVRLDGGRWVMVRRELQEIALTTWRGSSDAEEEEWLQVDVEPEPTSREAALLLLSVLAVSSLR